jgi:hypothetical protein
MGGACSTYGREILTGVLVGTPEGKKPPERSRHRREDNVAEIGMKGMTLNLFGCVQGQMEGSCEHGNKPLGSKKCAEFPG